MWTHRTRQSFPEQVPPADTGGQRHYTSLLTASSFCPPPGASQHSRGLRLSQSTGFGFPVSYIKLPLAICFTFGNVYVGTPLQSSCLENPMDGGAWCPAVHGVTKSRTRLSDFTSLTSFFIVGEGNGNPFQYSCLENPVDRGAWQALVHGVTKGWTRLK